MTSWRASAVMSVKASIGIAFSEGSRRSDELLKKADIAMYDAKTAKTGSSVFNEQMRGSMSKAWEFQQGIRQAIDDNQLVLHYQPLVSLENQRVVGVEALLRWQRPNGDLVSPGTEPITQSRSSTAPVGTAGQPKPLQLQRTNLRGENRHLSRSPRLSGRPTARRWFAHGLRRSLL